MWIIFKNIFWKTKRKHEYMIKYPSTNRISNIDILNIFQLMLISVWSIFHYLFLKYVHVQRFISLQNMYVDTWGQRTIHGSQILLFQHVSFSNKIEVVGFFILLAERNITNFTNQRDHTAFVFCVTFIKSRA